MPEKGTIRIKRLGHNKHSITSQRSPSLLLSFRPRLLGADYTRIKHGMVVEGVGLKPLSTLVAERKGQLPYEMALGLLRDIGRQLRVLEDHKLGFPFLSPEDITVVGDDRFAITSDAHMLPLKGGKLEILKPHRKGHFFPPEFGAIRGIPAEVSSKGVYYSLALIVAGCLSGRDVWRKPELTKALDAIYSTRLYWALKRCLEEDPVDRFFLII